MTNAFIHRQIILSMRQLLTILFFLLHVNILSAQTQTENVIIITLDGMRWQEIFKGIDDSIVLNSKFTSNIEGIKRNFDAPTFEGKRERLFPFLWNSMAKDGQLYGNRKWGNKINNANPYWFSYPGYNEIFTGYPDTAVNSNDKIWNKNENVLGFLNTQIPFKGKIAAFTTWDVFPYILNKSKSGIYVNSDVDTIRFKTPQLELINDMQFLTTRPIDVRPDIFTYMAAREYLKSYHPKVLYIAFDETDDFAHEGNYDQYLKSAHAQDQMIADLWKTVQSIPAYKNKTTLLITCDHGRGDLNKSDWQHHGSNIPGANEIWMAVMGPDTPPLGEIQQPMQLYQKQIAATIAKFFGLTFKANHPVAEPILSLFK